MPDGRRATSTEGAAEQSMPTPDPPFPGAFKPSWGEVRMEIPRRPRGHGPGVQFPNCLVHGGRSSYAVMAVTSELPLTCGGRAPPISVGHRRSNFLPRKLSGPCTAAPRHLWKVARSSPCSPTEQVPPSLGGAKTLRPCNRGGGTHGRRGTPRNLLEFLNDNYPSTSH